MTTATPDLLTPEEAARLLRTTPRTLANWRCTKRHDLPFTRPYGRVFYRRADLLAFIEGGTVRPGDTD